MKRPEFIRQAGEIIRKAGIEKAPEALATLLENPRNLAVIWEVEYTKVDLDMELWRRVFARLDLIQKALGLPLGSPTQGGEETTSPSTTSSGSGS